MLRNRTMVMVLACAVLGAPVAVGAHPGGLNAEGCHNNRKTGDYHCHRAGRGAGGGERKRGSGEAEGRRGAPPAGRAYANCAAARAAGAAPVRRGDPGYGPHLDRDGDGVGCE
jgi:hypothetical protein